MGKISDQSTIAESKARLVEQVQACFHSGNYPRALELLRGATGELREDSEFTDLQERAQDGIKRKAEADQLITESQELFAQQKSADAIELLRKAYELDKRNSLARAILANALVEHAQSIVETDWLKSETLTNQALALNPAHPTAKAVLNKIVERKQTSSVDEWVAQARKLQSSGDLFGALAWVAEGLAVHPDDSKLVQIQDEIQRDQGARKRQARRGDLDDLRRMEREIAKATEIAAKQALAERIQGLAAKHWTDGEILSIANALLLRLGLVSQESSGTSARGKASTLILHVPRQGGAKSAPAPATETAAAVTASNQVPARQDSASEVSSKASLPIQPSLEQNLQDEPLQDEEPAKEALPKESPSKQPRANNAPPKPIAPTAEPATNIVPPKVAVPPTSAPKTAVPKKPPARVAAPAKVPAPPEQNVPTQIASAPGIETAVSAAKASSPKAKATQPAKSNSTMVIVLSVAAIAIILVAATFFLTRRHYASEEAKTASTPAPIAVSTTTPPVSPAPGIPEPSAPAPHNSSPADTSSESLPPVPAASDANPTKETFVDPPSASAPAMGTLIIVAGQDDARVSLDGKLQRQVTRGGQVRLPSLAPKDYVVQVSKSGFQDAAPQKIGVRAGETAKLIFNLQPQPRLASLSIQGGAPGTTVLVDQANVGPVQADGTLAVSTINPGDHTVELRKDRFKPRQFKKTFTAGGVVALVAADAALEAAPSQLKITFTPADANVALVKGNILKIVSSGVPLTLEPGSYMLTARTAERFTRSSTVEVVAGQSKAVDLSLAPNGMSKFEDAGAWKHEGDSFTRKGGDFVLYGVVPVSGTFVFSAIPIKGHALQWVLNYIDSRNYVLIQMDENNFTRSVIRNGQKADEIIVPHKVDKKALRSLQIRVSATEIVHQIKQGESWRVLDHWTQAGVNLSQGKFGFYIPGNDQIAISNFAHYADLSPR